MSDDRTLLELLEDAHSTLVDFFMERGKDGGCEKVEDAIVLVYDAMALIDPRLADDKAEAEDEGRRAESLERRRRAIKYADQGSYEHAVELLAGRNRA